MKDVSETDIYGRLLRYVYLTNGTFVNGELVRLGYAEIFRYPPDTALCDKLEELVPIEITKNIEENDYSETLCSYNTYNCDDFSTHSEAQALYESCGGVSNDVHQLDRDKDGSACETLP